MSAPNRIELQKNRNAKIDWSSAGILIILAAMIILFGIMNPKFFTPKNLGNILRQISIVGICAVGMTAVILTGGIDLSVGSVIGITAVSGAMMLSSGMPIPIAIVLVILIGATAGGFNAFCVNIFGIPPLITTLGSMTALRGLIYVITGGKSVYGIPASFKFIGQGDIFIIPVSAIIMVIVFILGYVILNNTVFGRRIYGIGGNFEAARLSGIKVKLELAKVYIYAGMLSAIAGLVLMSKVNSGQPSAGDGYEMDIITAVVLGGVSVSGGEGKLIKVIIGVVFMGVLANGMMMLNIGEFQQRLVKGLVLIFAVALDIVSKNYSDTRGKKIRHTGKPVADSGCKE